MLRCSRGLLLQLGQRVAAPSLHFTRPISLLTASFYNGQSSSSFGSMPVSTMFLAVLTAMATGAVSCSEAENQADPGDSDQKLPIFRLEEISHHKTKETGIWVVYEGYVYDISRFVANHPGGREKIMMAAGGDIAPFWNLYRQHKNSVLATEMLHKMKIGRLHEEDAVKLKQQAEDASKGSTDEADPFSKDPTLSPIMKFYQRQPINAEPPGFVLTDSWITPADMWFVRNHHPVVNTPIDDVDHKHEVDICFARDLVDEAGQEKSIKSFTLADLKTKFPRHSVVSTVQCGGNRRAEMTSLERTNGSNWEISAISNAKWTGVRLRDVLAFMGITEESLFGEEGDDRKAPIKHVHFVSNDGMEASIPIKKALSRFGDVLLAYEMNDEPLPPKHGFPLRAIAPGHVGVRNVKWVSKIRLSGEEAYGTWQRGMAYKVRLSLSNQMYGQAIKSVFVVIGIRSFSEVVG